MVNNMNPATMVSLENDMNVELSPEVIDRAKGVVQKMIGKGNHRQVFPFFEGNSQGDGVVSDSTDGILVLGSFTFNGSTYYIGLPS